jgi:hypothetical protein
MFIQMKSTCFFLALVLSAVFSSLSFADIIHEANLQIPAKHPQNPFIAYSSLLLQWDYLTKLGPVDHYLTLNIQPAFPFHLNDQVDLLAFSDLPINSQLKMIYASAPGMKLGDYQQFLFFSRANTGNTYFGVGPVFSFPTATDSNLASGKWGIGPALQAAVFGEKISCGIIGYYLTSYAGDPGSPNISRTYWNPWLSYTLDQESNVGVQTEPYYNFIANQAQIPLEVFYNRFATLYNQLMKFTFDGLWWPVAPSYFPSWSLRFNITLFWQKY